MSAHLVQTEHGLQVHDAPAGLRPALASDREHRQPQVRPAGRNCFRADEPEVQIVPPPSRLDTAHRLPPTGPGWEQTFVTASAAAAYLGYADFRDLRKYVRAGLLTPYLRPLSNRPLYRRAEVEALVKPRAA